MVYLVAKKDRATRKRRKRIYTCPYEPIGVDVAVWGEEIRKMRRDAGLVNQRDFANACGWSPTLQSQYEATGRHEMKLVTICKMIRVCNGSE